MSTILDQPIIGKKKGAPPAHSDQALPKARVCIIDDEYMVGKGIQELLQYLGFACDYIQDGREAETFLAAHPEIDIVLLDINLGLGLSGIELLPALRKQNKYAQYIMFTSEDKLAVGLESMRRGAYDYMTKPFDEQAFIGKVPGALERKKMLKLNDLYLGILFHDIKNPVQGIMAGLDLLRMSLSEGTNDQDLQKTAFTQADLSIKQILMMINNIVSISKFENNTLPARRELFILQRETASALAPFAFHQTADESSRLEITYPSEEEILIRNDKELYSRVLSNIVGNALRYSGEGDPIKLAYAMEQNNEIHVMVTNTGSYIDDNARESIFNKFSSVEIPASQSGFKNYGLGLTFSKMAVDAMEGRIWIESTKEPASSTFHFTMKNHPLEGCSG
ncbi:MAG: hybrid sensor histidine kinase/response regulator [Chitinispirillaceae bacterium]|nr:hybrid sensor histidine kinase/response regulator [Chitinispirillaceae bacterium]